MNSDSLEFSGQDSLESAKPLFGHPTGQEAGRQALYRYIMCKKDFLHQFQFLTHQETHAAGGSVLDFSAVPAIRCPRIPHTSKFTNASTVRNYTSTESAARHSPLNPHCSVTRGSTQRRSHTNMKASRSVPVSIHQHIHTDLIPYKCAECGYDIHQQETFKCFIKVNLKKTSYSDLRPPQKLDR